MCLKIENPWNIWFTFDTQKPLDRKENIIFNNKRKIQNKNTQFFNF